MVDTKIVDGLSYEKIKPRSTYAPWRQDAAFIQVREHIKPNTLVDGYRSYELWELVKQVAHLPGDLIEIGVWRGGTGALIAAGAKAAGKTVYLCDTFTGVVKAGDQDSRYQGGEHADTSLDTVKTLLADMKIDNAEIRVGIFPDDHADEFKSHQFCLVHVDVDVYLSGKDVVEYVWPHMPVGGIVVFDDYGFMKCTGIAKLADEYRAHADKLVIYNLNGHAVMVKVA